MATKLSTWLALSAWLAMVSARPEFRDRVPNAYNVVGVEAIGHKVHSGSARNAFGKDFDANGRKWTLALCLKDSDNDGQTNGQELGDPCCAWVQASNEKTLWTQGVSAPGDALSKSDPALWANVSCPSRVPSASPTSTSSRAQNQHSLLAVAALSLAAAVLLTA